MERQLYSSKELEQPTHSAISQAAANAGSIECQREDPVRPFLGSTAALPRAVATQSRTTRNDTAMRIGQAYDGIHRIQAILAYIRIMNINNPGFSPILDEAKHTYGQALALYEARDFEGALEFAAASRELSQALEIVISRVLRSDSLYPTLVLMPPEHETSINDSIRMQQELNRVECLLSLIHRAAENGSSLSEDQSQALNIASSSERLLGMARHLLRFAEMQGAIDLIHAAAVIARAAKHVCRRWYATQGIDPFLPPGTSSCNVR
jgi:hypothetical protein